jgi:HEPN domain-containing protein
MIEHHLFEFAKAYHHLCGHCDQLMGAEFKECTTIISEQRRGFVIQHALSPLIAELEHLNLNPDVTQRAKEFRGRLGQHGVRWTVELLLSELLRFQQDLNRELYRRKFAYISSAYDKYFEQEMVFGAGVYKKIPDARQDIKDAGNSMAVGLYTACVFHLMRSAEHGLRKLARRLKVTLLHKQQPSPLKEEDWEKLIVGIEGKITSARQIPLKAEKREQLKLYSDLAQHSRYIRDIFRNDVSHTGDSYNEHDAKQAWSRVGPFMQLIANGKIEPEI